MDEKILNHNITYEAKGSDASSSKNMIVRVDDIRKEEVAMDDKALSEILIDDSEFEALIGERVYMKEESRDEWKLVECDVDMEEGEQDIDCKTGEFLCSEQEQGIVQHTLRSEDSSDKPQCTQESEKQQLACQPPDTTANKNTG